MNRTLTDLFQKKQRQSKKAKGGGIDWDDRRNGYLTAVDDLYGQIKRILATPLARKTATLHRRPKQLTESYIGNYSIDDLILVAGGEQVRFSPRGRNIAGASGRVDVVGERGEEVLIVQPDGRWEVVQSRQPTLKVMPLDESSLAEVLKLVMRD